MIVAFVYDFPHFKSAQGLFALKRAGFHDVRCVAAPWRKLPMVESHYQFRTLDMGDAHHPRDAAAALGYEYEVADHATVRLGAGDVGLILGARVLPACVVETGPIVNLHPGVLPLNRGLDTLKWAVHDGLPQAVSVHRIDARVDRGELLLESIVPVRQDDSPADIYNRLMWRQIALVPEAVRLAHAKGEPIGKGVYRRPMTLEEDVRTQARFMAYKVRYNEERQAA
jgi:hypothetical protein